MCRLCREAREEARRRNVESMSDPWTSCDVALPDGGGIKCTRLTGHPGPHRHDGAERSVTWTKEPDPVPTEERPVWELVIEDMKARDNLGRQKYGTPLQASNGRDPLVDAYQEALDLAVYLKQEIIKRTNR